MNADKRRLKRIGLSVFIGVNRRLKMPFSDFFSSLLISDWGADAEVHRRRGSRVEGHAGEQFSKSPWPPAGYIAWLYSPRTRFPTGPAV